MNKRKEIRLAVIQKLDGIIYESKQLKIFDQRYITANPKSTPIIIIYTNGDESTETPDEQALERNEILLIRLIVAGKEEHELDVGQISVMNKLDSIIDDIEDILNYDRQTLNSVVYRMTYKNTRIGVENSGEQIILIANITYICKYYDTLKET